MVHMAHTDEATALAAYLAAHIEQQGWSERDAAKNLGFTRSTLRRRLNKADFKLWELRLIAQRLDLTPAELAKRLEVAA